jgi:eukaryotic-like serine/threonine-protein kinase
MSNNRCPSATDLDRLLADQLPPREAAQLEKHLAECPGCQNALQGLATNDILFDELRRGQALAEFCEGHAVDNLVRRLQQLNPPGPQAITTEAARTGISQSKTLPDGREYLSPPQQSDEIGRLGPYGVLKVLGAGGMGIVFLARQKRPGRLVALKMILAGPVAGRQRLDRFRVETEVVARLQHPNIIQIHEVGEHSGLPYFTMEYAVGGSLAQRLTRAPLAPRAAAELLEALANAVHFAHERGFLHRDLKPSNILLQSDPSSGERQGDKETGRQGGVPVSASPGLPLSLSSLTPKIGDFGLAKQFAATPDETGLGQRTESGALLGTPNYMAPEQACGSNGVGPPADVYALGAILYECLTGRPPFRAATVLETLEQVRSQEPVQPARLQPHLPRDLQTITLKCLEKEPSRRYPSARDLADDLGRYLRGEPIQARPASVRERLSKWVRRRPAVASLVAVSALSLATFVIGVLVYDARLRGAVRQANDSANEAKEQRQQARESERSARLNEAAVQKHIYSAEMRLANELLKAGEFSAMSVLVDRHDPDRTHAADQRGFEWRYLRRFRDIDQARWEAHTGELNLLTFSSDTQVLMTASYADRLAKTWRLPTGELLATFPIRKWSDSRHREAGALSPDGKTAATIVDLHSVAIWDAATGRRKARVTHSGQVLCVAFSPDGQYLLTGGDDQTKLWRCGSWELGIRLDSTRLAGFSPDNTTLARVWAPGYSSQIQLFDLKTGRVKPSIQHWYPVLDIAFTKDGRFLASVSDGPRGTRIELNNVNTGQWSGTMSWNDAKLRHIAFSADGELLASATQDGTLRFWQPEHNQTRGSFHGGARRISQFEFSPDGRWLATATDRGTVTLWNRALLGGPEPMRVSTPCRGTVVFDPKRSRVAVATADHGVAVIDVATGRAAVRLNGHLGQVSDAAFSPDGTRLATVDRRHMCCWDAMNGRQLWQTEAAGAVSVAWSPVAPLLAAGGGSDHDVRLYDAATGSETGVLKGHTGEITTVRFFPDGKRAASAGFDRAVRIWDLAARKEALSPLMHDVPVLSLAIANDGRELAAGLTIGKLILWTLNGADRERREIPWLAKYEPWVAGQASTICFSPDGAQLGTAGPGGIFRAEQRARRKFLYAVNGSSDNPDSAAYSADGSILATFSQLNELFFWDTNTWIRRKVSGAPLSVVRTLAFSADSKTLAIACDHLPDQQSKAIGDFPDRANVRLADALGRPDLAKGSVAWRDYVPWQATTDSLRFWDVRAGAEQSPLAAMPTLTDAPKVVWSHAGNTLAAAACDGSVWVWDMTRGKVVKRLFLDDRIRKEIESARSSTPSLVPQSVLPASPTSPLLAISPDGGLLAAVTPDGAVKLWDSADWRELQIPGKHVDGNCLVFSPDGQTLAVNDRGRLKLYDPRTGQLRSALGEESASPILCAQFSPDGNLLAVGTMDGGLQRVELASQTSHTLVGHTDGVSSAAFCPDGKTLATGSWDRTVRLWDVALGRGVAVLEGHHGRVHCVAFSPDGSVLASGGEIDDRLPHGQGEFFLWRAGVGLQHSERPVSQFQP